MRTTLTLLSFLIALPLFSQQINSTDFKNLKIRNIGPAGMSGRVTAIDVALTPYEKIYVGTASGLSLIHISEPTRPY